MNRLRPVPVFIGDPDRVGKVTMQGINPIDEKFPDLEVLIRALLDGVLTTVTLTAADGDDIIPFRRWLFRVFGHGSIVTVRLTDLYQIEFGIFSYRLSKYATVAYPVEVIDRMRGGFSPEEFLRDLERKIPRTQ